MRTRLSGGNLAEVWRDGPVVTKTYGSAAIAGAEAAGLRWLACFDGPPVPQVVAAGSGSVCLDYVEEGGPTPEGAASFGTALAALHRSPLDVGFGWAPGGSFIGTVPADVGIFDSWAELFRARLDAVLTRLPVTPAVFQGLTVERLTSLVPAPPPAPVHGDLWSGNVLWDTGGRGWLIDPAAHVDHPELDVAMLALFGAPHLGVTLEAWAAAYRPEDGWRERLGLHQLPHVLFHAYAFGGGYLERASAVAARYV